MAKNSKFVAVSLIVLAVGGVGAYLYFKGWPGKLTDPLETAQIIPEDALMAAFISPNPQALAQLKQFGTPEVQQSIEQGLTSFKDETQANHAINLDNLSWIGGVMLAVMPAPEEVADSSPNLLAVIGIKDKLRAWYFLSQLKKEEGVTIAEQEYEGEKILSIEPESGNKYYASMIGDYILMAPEAELIQRAIDTQQGGASLVSQPAVQEVFSEGLNLENPVATIFIADYANTMQQLSNQPGTATTASSWKQLENVESMLVGVGIDQQGIRSKILTSLKPGTVKAENRQNNSGESLKKFPEETLLLINGQQISQGWSQMTEMAQEAPEMKLGLDGIRQGLRGLNLDADREVFGWMDGEFAIGIIRSDQGNLAPLGFGGAILMETSDRTTADATLKKLEALMAGNPQLEIQTGNINNVAVTTWEVFPQGKVLGYGWQDQNSLVIAFGEPILSMMLNSSSNSLTGSKNFATIAGTLPTPNQGYFYLNMDQVLPLLERFLFAAPPPYQIPPDVVATLKSMQGVGITATWLNESTSQVETLFALKKTQDIE